MLELLDHSGDLNVAESDFKAGIGRAVMKTCFIVVCVRISSRAIPMNELDVLSLHNGTGTALLGRDWWSWTAVVVSRVVLFVASQSEWARVVPSLAWRQTHGCSTILDNPQVADIVFSARTRVKTQVAVSGSARSLLAAGNNSHGKRVSIDETDVVPS